MVAASRLVAATLALLHPAVSGAAMHVDLVPARARTALRHVSPHYISFALDEAFVHAPTTIPGEVQGLRHHLRPDPTSSFAALHPLRAVRRALPSAHAHRKLIGTGF